MDPTPPSPEVTARRFVEAINRHDVEALAALMSAGHRFIDSLGTTIEGRDKMRLGWTGYFKMVPDYEIAVEETFTNGAAVVLMGIARGTYSKDGGLAPENRWQTPIAIRALIEDNLIAEWRVYADNDPIRKLMAADQ
jgi:ketosteroid isomerase-like protein